ncbi:MAG: M23 family metallopeptidase [Dehalococcoidia bacterium]
MSWGRREFLRFAAGGAALVPLALAGCGGDDAPPASSAGGSPPRGATSTGSGASGDRPTPAPPVLALSATPQQVGVGESLRLVARAPGASGVAIDFRSAAYRMLAVPDGSFWLVLGVPLDAALASDSLRGSARDAAGQALASAELPYTVVAVDRPADYLTLTPEEASVITQDATVREADIRGLQFAQFDPLPRWSGFFVRPTDGAITTLFGQGRSINGGPVGAFHTGVDLANDAGTPVQVAAPGRVAWTGSMPIRGESVIVDHGAGVKTGYHHLSAITSAVGDEVRAGEVIGLVGMTGLSTGPHLHWELTLWGVNVDPMTWLTTPFGPL